MAIKITPTIRRMVKDREFADVVAEIVHATEALQLANAKLREIEALSRHARDMNKGNGAYRPSHFKAGSEGP